MNLVQRNRYIFVIANEKLKKGSVGFATFFYTKSRGEFFWKDEIRPFIFYNLTPRKKLWLKFKRLFK